MVNYMSIILSDVFTLPSRQSNFNSDVSDRWKQCLKREREREKEELKFQHLMQRLIALLLFAEF